MAGTLRIRKQSITELDVDCIVNAANSQLRHGGGVCGEIFAAAGASQLQAACDALGHCPTGEAVITPGFKLKAKSCSRTSSTTLKPVTPMLLTGRLVAPKIPVRA